MYVCACVCISVCVNWAHAYNNMNMCMYISISLCLVADDFFFCSNCKLARVLIDGGLLIYGLIWLIFSISSWNIRKCNQSSKFSIVD